MTETAAPPENFTPRQLQVVVLLAAGCSAGEIADSLGISARTVRMHCDTLRAKLRVRRRRQIPAAFAWRTGLDPLATATAEDVL